MQYMKQSPEGMTLRQQPADNKTGCLMPSHTLIPTDFHNCFIISCNFFYRFFSTILDRVVKESNKNKHPDMLHMERSPYRMRSHAANRPLFWAKYTRGRTGFRTAMERFQ